VVEGQLEHGTPNAFETYSIHLLEKNCVILHMGIDSADTGQPPQWSNRFSLQITQPVRSTVTHLYQLRRLSTVYVTQNIYMCKIYRCFSPSRFLLYTYPR
jgi:hypothetical protein